MLEGVRRWLGVWEGVLKPLGERVFEMGSGRVAVGVTVGEVVTVAVKVVEVEGVGVAEKEEVVVVEVEVVGEGEAVKVEDVVTVREGVGEGLRDSVGEGEGDMEGAVHTAKRRLWLPVSTMKMPPLPSEARPLGEDRVACSPPPLPLLLLLSRLPANPVPAPVLTSPRLFMRLSLFPEVSEM